jgi:alpha-glucosidase
MLGPNLLVASVLEGGARTRSVYLPVGQEDDGWWCDFYTGQWHRGGRIIEVDAPLERIPLLVPAGGIIPLGKVMRHVGEQPDDLRQVYIFPPPTQGQRSFTLIEDDGLSMAYQRGDYTEVTVEVMAEPDQILLHVNQQGQYTLPYTEIECILPPGETRPVQGKAVKKIQTDDRQRQRVHLSV